MKLVAAPSGTVDRTDRALWLSLGFDIAWSGAPIPAAPLELCAAPTAGILGGRGLAQGAGAGRLMRARPATAAGAGLMGRELSGAPGAGGCGRELAQSPETGSW